MERLDLKIITGLIPLNAKVLDLGCGDGELLAALIRDKQANARGVELSETKVRACIARGVPVRQGNIEEGLADFRDGVFDYVVLSDTIGYLNEPVPVVREMLRVGARSVISFANAGHWRSRVQSVLGRGYGTSLASGEPRIRAITLDQFEAFIATLGARVEHKRYVNGRGHVNNAQSLAARMAVYVIRAE